MVERHNYRLQGTKVGIRPPRKPMTLGKKSRPMPLSVKEMRADLLEWQQAHKAIMAGMKK